MANKRIVLITGGASGIGRATTKKFSSNGDHVVIADINEKSGTSLALKLMKNGFSVEYIYVDVADERSVQQMTNKINDKCGGIDILINSAGVLQNISKINSMDLEEHDRIWLINYRGTYLCCRSVGKLMCSQKKKGSIINISSTSAARAFPLLAYGPAKASIDQLTAILASDLGKFSIRVNAVMPGYVLTEQMQSRIDDGYRDRTKMDSQSALGRMVHPSEIADGIFFLCSDDASAITGIVLPIDGGWLSYVTYNQHPGLPFHE